jgi:hypothetical protein
MLRATSLRTSSVDNILTIHDVLVRDFAASGDPISTSGLRSRDLLESAVGRQDTSLGGVLKYPEPVANAATLGYNAQLEAVFQGQDARIAELASEMERLEGQASHLVRFLTTGGDSPAVRAELRTIETTLERLRAE